MNQAVHIFILIIIISGCLSNNPNNNSLINGKAFPLSFENHGQNITIETQPERIISLAPSNTEIIYALDLGKKVVGVTEYDDYPEEVREKEKIGGFNTVNIEKILSLNPDLVLATGGVQIETVQKLRELGLTVVVLDAKDLGEVLENILLIGKITGVDERAETLQKDLKKRIDAVKKNVQENENRPKVAYILWGDPLMVAGNGTFITDIITAAGGENVFSDSIVQYPQVSMESMIERDPEIIINGDHSAMNLTDLKNRPEWKEITAVRENRLHTINADIVSRPGPRLVNALELFSQWISREGLTYA